jgi:hypothetical protein
MTDATSEFGDLARRLTIALRLKAAPIAISFSKEAGDAPPFASPRPQRIRRGARGPCPRVVSSG